MVFVSRGISRRGAEESKRRHKEREGLMKTGLPGLREADQERRNLYS